MSKKALVFLTDGFEDVEALSAVDVLRRGGVNVVTVSLSGSQLVRSSHNVHIKADTVFDRLQDECYDALILPGGPGTEAYFEDRQLKKLLKKCCHEGKIIAAICAAPTYLDAIGLLDGKKAVCYPGRKEQMKKASLVDEKVVIDGNIITSLGPSTSLFFGLAILEALMGTQVKDQVYDDMHISYIDIE